MPEPYADADRPPRVCVPLFWIVADTEWIPVRQQILLQRVHTALLPPSQPVQVPHARDSRADYCFRLFSTRQRFNISASGMLTSRDPGQR
jgi:hypothetical protein